MKKTLSILMALILIGTLFTGCTGQTVELTPENAKQYLTVNLHTSPIMGVLSSYAGYDVTGEISGVAGYTYNDVVVTISFYDEDGVVITDDTYATTVTAQLNVGGNATISSDIYYVHYGDEDVTYEITDITGTVTKD